MATITVRPGESVTEAANDAARGDVVQVADGAYSGGLRLERPEVTIRGSKDAVVTGHVYITRSAVETTVDGGTWKHTGGVRTNPTVDADGLTWRHSVIDNQNMSIAMHLGGDSGSGRAGNAHVHHNVFKNIGRKPWTNYDHGVYLKWAPDAVIEHNTFEGGGDYAVHFWAGASPRTIVRNNLMIGGWAGAVIFGGNAAGGSDGGTFTRNVVVGPPRPGRTMIYEFVDGWSGAKTDVFDNVFVGEGPFLLPSPRTYSARGNLTVPRLDAVPAGYGPQGGAPPPPPPPPPNPYVISAPLRDALSELALHRMAQQKGRAGALEARFLERRESGYAQRAAELAVNADIYLRELADLLAQAEESL